MALGHISFSSYSRKATVKTKSTTSFSNSSFLSFYLCISILISSFFVSSSFGEPKTKKDGKDCIYIGNLYSVGISGTVQAGLAVGLAFEDINNDESILPNYKLCNITKIKDDVAGANKALVSYHKKGVLGVIGPSFSSQTTVTGILATYLQIPLLSPSATAKSLSDKSIYEYFIRNVPPDDRQAIVNAELIQHFRWKDVAVLATTEAYSVGLAEEFIAIAKSYDISIRNVGFFPTTVSKQEIRNLLNILQSTGVRIIVLYMFSPQWITVMEVASELDLIGYPYVYIGPDGLSTSTLFINNGSVDTTLAQAFKGMLTTTPALGDTNSKRFKDLFKRLSKLGSDTIESYSTYGYDAVWVMAHAIDELVRNNGGDVDGITGKDLLKQLKKTNYRGLSGTIKFDKHGNPLDPQYTIFNHRLEMKEQKEVDNKRRLRLRDLLEMEGMEGLEGLEETEEEEDTEEKVLTGVLKEVGNWTSKSSVIMTSDPIWMDGSKRVPDGTPKGAIEYYSCYEEETFVDRRGIVEFDNLNDNPDFIDSKSVCDSVIDCDNWSDEPLSCSTSITLAYIIVGVAAVIFEIIIVFGFLFTIVYRKRGRVRASGVFFLQLVCAAAFCGVASIFTFYGKANTGVCTFRIWLIFTSAGLLVGALCAKQWKIWKVFGNNSLKKIVVTDKDLLLVVCLVLAPTWIILVVWSSANTPETHTEKDDDNTLHLICREEPSTLIYIIVLVVYEGLLLLGNSCLAFRTRHMPSSYSETKLIAFALYNATVTGSILIPIVLALDGEIFIQWIVATLFIIFWFFSGFIILFWTKLYGVFIVDRGKSIEELNRLPDTSTSIKSNGSG